jgi:hypothetical protein
MNKLERLALLKQGLSKGFITQKEYSEIEEKLLSKS